MTLCHSLLRATAKRRTGASAATYFASAQGAGATSVFKFDEGVNAATYVDSIGGKNLAYSGAAGRVAITPPNAQFSAIYFPTGARLSTPAATAAKMLVNKDLVWTYEVICKRPTTTAEAVFLLTQTCREINQNHITSCVLDHPERGDFFIYEANAVSSNSGGSVAPGSLDFTNWVMLTFRSVGPAPSALQVYVNGVLNWTFNRTTNYDRNLHGPVTRSTLLWRDFGAAGTDGAAISLASAVFYDNVVLTPAQILANAQTAGFA